jgi:malonyl-CoA decarboxylase
MAVVVFLVFTCKQTVIQEMKDPVARFHLGNGASLYALNWEADMCERRIKESYGIMANYDYNGNIFF